MPELMSTKAGEYLLAILHQIYVAERYGVAAFPPYEPEGRLCGSSDVTGMVAGWKADFWNLWQGAGGAHISGMWRSIGGKVNCGCRRLAPNAVLQLSRS